MIGASTPGINTTAKMFVTISGNKNKASPTQALKQLVQLNGLKSKYHFLWNWCISTKNNAKLIAANIVIIIFIYLIVRLFLLLVQYLIILLFYLSFVYLQILFVQVAFY